MEGHPFRDPPSRQLPSTQIKASGSRVTKFLAIGAFASVWNVICGVMFAGTLSSSDTFFTIFLSIFLIVGAVLIGVAIHAFLAIFNPTIELHVTTALPALGETLDVRWHVVGNASRIEELRIDLVGLESATYRRGTDTTTETHEFARFQLAHTADWFEIADGAGSVVISAGAVPSFTGRNNKIIWEIRIAGVILRWPDLADQFRLEVVANKQHRKHCEAA